MRKSFKQKNLPWFQFLPLGDPGVGAAEAPGEAGNTTATRGRARLYPRTSRPRRHGRPGSEGAGGCDLQSRSLQQSRHAVSLISTPHPVGIALRRGPMCHVDRTGDRKAVTGLANYLSWPVSGGVGAGHAAPRAAPRSAAAARGTGTPRRASSCGRISAAKHAGRKDGRGQIRRRGRRGRRVRR